MGVSTPDLSALATKSYKPFGKGGGLGEGGNPDPQGFPRLHQVSSCTGQVATAICQYQSLWKRFQDWLLADTVSINQALIISYLAYASETLAPRTVLSTDVPKSFVYELVNYC